jgi:hypothetical protein
VNTRRVRLPLVALPGSEPQRSRIAVLLCSTCSGVPCKRHVPLRGAAVAGRPTGSREPAGAAYRRDVPDEVTPKDIRVADQHIHRAKRILNLVNSAHTLSWLGYIRHCFKGTPRQVPQSPRGHSHRCQSSTTPVGRKLRPNQPDTRDGNRTEDTHPADRRNAEVCTVGRERVPENIGTRATAQFSSRRFVHARDCRSLNACR